MKETVKTVALDLATIMNQNLTALGEISIAFKCPPTTTLREALNTLQGAKIGCLIIADGPNVLGIITERDMLMKVAGKDLDMEYEVVSTYMTKDPVVISRKDTIADAMRLMVTYNFRHLIIAESKTSMVQIISIKDLCQYVVNALDQHAAAKIHSDAA